MTFEEAFKKAEGLSNHIQLRFYEAGSLSEGSLVTLAKQWLDLAMLIERIGSASSTAGQSDANDAVHSLPSFGGLTAKVLAEGELLSYLIVNTGTKLRERDKLFEYRAVLRRLVVR